MNETKDRLILRSRLSKANQTLTPEQTRAVELAMIDASIYSVENYRTNQAKAINREAVGLIGKIFKDEWVLTIRRWYFKRAKKQAQILADTSNRKIYVLRSSDIAYSLLSTADVDFNKKKRVLGKNIGAKELTETADFVAMPSNLNRIKPVRVLTRKN